MGDDESFPREWKEMVFEKIQKIAQASKFLVPSENSYYCSSVPGFRSKLKGLSDTVRGIIKKVADTSELLLKSRGVIREYDDERFDDLYENYEAIIDLVDSLLERTAKNIESASSTEEKRDSIFANKPVIVSLQPRQTLSRPSGVATQFSILHSENVPRPQLKFKEKVDNSNTPFVIRLVDKANALVPLGHEVKSDQFNGAGRDPDPQDISGSACQEANPYYYEIIHVDYPPHQLSIGAETVYLPIEQTPLRWVGTPEDLHQLLDALGKCDLISVDLEHHSYRSYLGFTCLIQISSREEDYIIDALALRSELQALNKIFTDPKILKVFHGAEMDIKWLQKDFGIYVVNMFDTGQASRVLGLLHSSLAYLLKRYCNVITTKHYQLADWRIRPLVPKMIEYARKDTHYLPYIYDRMKNELLEASSGDTDKLLLVYERSAQLCCAAFVKEIYDHNEGKGVYGWRAALKRIRPVLAPEQSAVFRAIHSWRDTIARQEDESPGFVIPSALLVTIAQKMPTSVQDLLNTCRIPTPMIKQYAMDIVRLINDTRTNYAKSLALDLQNADTPSGSQTGTPTGEDNFIQEVIASVLSDDPDTMETTPPGVSLLPQIKSTSVSRLFPELSSSFYSIQTKDVIKVNRELCKKFFFSSSHIQNSQTFNQIEPESPKKDQKFDHDDKASPEYPESPPLEIKKPAKRQKVMNCVPAVQEQKTPQTALLKPAHSKKTRRKEKKKAKKLAAALLGKANSQRP